MSIVTTSTLAPPVQLSFDYKLLSTPVPYLIHLLPADFKTMPANGGSILRMRRYNPLPTATVPLGNSGVVPAPTNLSAVNLDAPMQLYGQFIMINEQVTLQSQDAPLNEACARLGVSLRQTEDQLMRDTLGSTSATINAVGGTNGDVPAEMTYSDIMSVIKALRGNSAYTFLDGLGGENKFGTAPKLKYFFENNGRFKPLVIDLECLAA